MLGVPFVLLQNSRDKILLLLKQSLLSFLGEILPFCSSLGWKTSYEGQLRRLELLSLEERLKGNPQLKGGCNEVLVSLLR